MAMSLIQLFPHFIYSLCVFIPYGNPFYAQLLDMGVPHGSRLQSRILNFWWIPIGIVRRVARTALQYREAKIIMWTKMNFPVNALLMNYVGNLFMVILIDKEYHILQDIQICSTQDKIN